MPRARRSHKTIKDVKPATTEPEAVDTAYIDPDGGYRLPRDQFWKWRALEADIQLQFMTIQKSKIEFDAILARHPELSHLKRVIAGAKERMNARVKEHKDFQAEVEGLTGLDLKKCTIDDVSGRITVVVDEPAADDEKNSKNSVS